MLKINTNEIYNMSTNTLLTNNHIVTDIKMTKLYSSSLGQIVWPDKGESFINHWNV